MFPDLDDTRSHYDRVLRSRPNLYYERFDLNMLENRPLVAELLAKAFAKTFPQSPQRVLDLGCGTCFYYPILAKHTEQLTGMDISAEMLVEANQVISASQLNNCRVIQASALEIPLADASVDVVHSWDFLHHVSNIDRVLGEIHRVLKPNGRYVAFEPNLLNPSITWYHARRRNEWRLFTQNQFTIPRKMSQRFHVQVNYDNTIISFLDEKTEWLWNLANSITSFPPLDRLSFRYVIDATRRA